ncbi:MAG TPA: GPP34 family phosphoprotein [Stackebrandtia sp.]|uniref:GOLPH3/VPS74 family protein n=1 Tax=Stackebrandtia sp. TaxID=2023065 RepID=UPI002D6F5547|nr:GPP34 family phosphoprotein [Stackebrandtia sp.]HZE38395.1 GPP34 family phosphoprotein [Stackebrandtia sp.]
MLITEELLLLAYQPETGRNTVHNLELGLIGACLLDLTLAERLSLSGNKITVVNAAGIGNTAADDVLARINGDKPRKPRGWIDRLHRGFPRALRESMVAQGILNHDNDHILGFIPFNRYRPTSPTPSDDARRRLGEFVDTARPRDDRTAALAAMVYAMKMERKALPDRPRRDVRGAFKSAAEHSWAADATGQAIQATQAAVTAAVVAATSAAAAAASSGGGS